MIGKSISLNRIISAGKGKKEPIRENTTNSGKQANKRVEIMVVK